MTEKDIEKIEKLKIQELFGNHIAKIRKINKISAAELGRRTYMERSNIAKIESGSANLTLFTLIKIAKAMQISLIDLVKDFKY